MMMVVILFPCFRCLCRLSLWFCIINTTSHKICLCVLNADGQAIEYIDCAECLRQKRRKNYTNLTNDQKENRPAKARENYHRRKARDNPLNTSVNESGMMLSWTLIINAWVIKGTNTINSLGSTPFNEETKVVKTCSLAGHICGITDIGYKSSRPITHMTSCVSCNILILW